MANILNTISEKDSTLLQFNCGLERETLRTTPRGRLAQSDHPRFLGSKLFNPRITTDFAESQLELITPVCESSAEALKELYKIHQFIYSSLEDEILWPASMPCALPRDQEIPIARYGQSNLAQLKETYRRGLASRYGRTMQTICAIHYNFSFKDSFWKALKNEEHSPLGIKEFRTSRYFDLLRNFQRLSWLPTYLFGASPVVSESFLQGTQQELSKLDNSTWYQSNATSLRNGNLGYKSATQSSLLNISYNSLEEYLFCLAEGICTNYHGYRELDVSNLAQINTNILQSEAEFYSSVRAKRIPRQGLNSLSALQQDGVEYIEVRLLDIDPYEPLGISEDTINFLDILLLHCLMTPSPKHDKRLTASIDLNMESVVYEGRSSGVQLDDMRVKRSVREWGRIILEQLEDISLLLDQVSGSNSYSSSIAKQKAKIENPDLTPSALLLKDLDHQSFQEFAIKQSLSHRATFLKRPLEEFDFEFFSSLAEASFVSQKKQDAIEQKMFSDYLFEVQDEYKSIYQSLKGNM